MAKAQETTVADIMETDVTTVGPTTTVRELAKILSEQGISGVPVVSDTGAVVGVVSSSDVVQLTAVESELGIPNVRTPRPPPGDWPDDREPVHEDIPTDVYSSYFLPEDAPHLEAEWTAEFVEGVDTFDELSVADIMTPVSFTMPPTASVHDLADFLLRGRIHRAIVTENDHLVGIVTTMDVLRALVEGKV